MRRRKLFWVTLVLAILVAVSPYESTIVPAWKLRVVDETGTPYVGKQVNQTWKHYSLDKDPGTNIESRYTDSNGYVAFPERTIKASLLSRVVRSVYSAAMTLAHGGYGVHAYVSALGPQGYESVNYSPNQLPTQMILASKDKRSDE